MDSAASVPVIEKLLARKQGVWKRARKVDFWQVDVLHLSGGNCMDNTSYKAFDFVCSSNSATVSFKFSLDAEVLYIGHEDCILGLSCLTVNAFVIAMHERSLRNAISGLVIPCSVRCIASSLFWIWISSH